MSIKKLPTLNASAIKSLKFDTPVNALDKWQSDIKAADEEGNSITIYQEIGENWYGEGTTASSVRQQLQSFNGEDVKIFINSPGGDFFEGVAIYNELATYKGKVSVNIMGLAASAASVIAMAGDEVNIADGAFLMIHNAWTVAMGNRHDMVKVAEVLAPFDDAMAGLYVKKTGLDKATIVEMMDKETWLGQEKSIDLNFANDIIKNDKITHEENDPKSKALGVIEKALAKEGMPRSQRRELLKDIFKSKPSATQSVMPGANEEDEEVVKGLQNLIKTMRK